MCGEGAVKSAHRDFFEQLMRRYGRFEAHTKSLIIILKGIQSRIILIILGCRLGQSNIIQDLAPFRTITIT